MQMGSRCALGSPTTNLLCTVSPSLVTPVAVPASSYTTCTSGFDSMYVPPYTALSRANACLQVARTLSQRLRCEQDRRCCPG